MNDRVSWQRPGPAVTVVASAALIWLLSFLAVVLVPLAFALFLSALLIPLSEGIRRAVPGKLGWLGPLTSLFILLGVLSGVVGAAVIAVNQLDSAGVEVPQNVVDRFFEGRQSDSDMAENSDRGNVGNDGGTLEDGPGSESDTATGTDTGTEETSTGGEDPVSDLTGRILDVAREYAGQLVGSILSYGLTLLTSIVIVLFLTLLMLIEFPSWREKLETSLDRTEEHQVFDAFSQIASQLRLYLLGRTIAGLVSAALYVAWLAIYGVDLLFVWGALTFLLSYIPSVGSIISGVLAGGYALLTKDFGAAIIIGAGLLAIEQVVGNFLDPLIQGRAVGVSAFVVLVALIFWGFLWGIPGALLAVPMTIVLINVTARLPGYEAVALMLSNRNSREDLRELVQR